MVSHTRSRLGSRQTGDNRGLVSVGGRSVRRHLVKRTRTLRLFGVARSVCFCFDIMKTHSPHAVSSRRSLQTLDKIPYDHRNLIDHLTFHFFSFLFFLSMRVEVLKKKCSYHSAGPGLTGEVDRGLFAAEGGSRLLEWMSTGWEEVTGRSSWTATWSSLTAAVLRG